MYMNDLERIQRLRLLDDDFMRVIFQDWNCCQLLLEILLDRKDFKIVELQTQKDLKYLYGKSVCLDVWIHTSQKQTINVEVQRNEEGAHPTRARYHASLIDSNASFPNEKYKELDEVYIIFITETDVLKHGLPIYHVERRIEETNSNFNDEMHIVYVHAQNQDNTSIGRLMHDFQCTKAGDMYYDTLRERVAYFKENEGGIQYMCKIWDEVRQEGIELGKEQGIELGKEQEKIQTATNLWKEGIQDLKLIQKVSGLSEARIQEILGL